MFYVFFRHAKEVSVADEVLVEVNDKLIPAKVANVSNFILQGDNQFHSFSSEFYPLLNLIPVSDRYYML